MRAVRFVKRLQWELPGTVFRQGMTIGDVDNDGDNELVVGTAEGDLYIFKGLEIWQKITGLGLISCVAIGDIFNYGCNALVVICGDGWAHIFYSPRSVNPSNTSLPAINLPAVKKDIPAGDSLKLDTSNPAAGLGPTTIDKSDNANENNELSGKMECVHLQRIPTNTKVVLIADVDRDGANEMIIGLTDRVVRSYRWSTNADLGTGKLVGLNKWECANQIGTVTLQHMGDGIPTLLVAQPGGTFMRIKCNSDDHRSKEGTERSSEAAASCVDYQTLGISRMRNPNISTEIIGDLDPGACHLTWSRDDKQSKFVLQNDSSVGHSFLDDSRPVSRHLKSGSLKFRRNFSQPDMRKSSLDGTMYDYRRSDTHARDRTPARFYSRVNSPEVDQVDGNLLGGNVILGDYESDTDKKSYFPSYEDFSRNNKKLSEEEEEEDEVGGEGQGEEEEEEEEEEEADEEEKVKEKEEKKKKKKKKKNKYNKTEATSNVGDREGVIGGKPYALATLDGTIMLVKDEIILWAMQVDHQIFALCRLDVTGDGADEIVACTWDGQTYILDQQRRSVRFQFEEPVRAFCTGKYSVKPGTSTPCLVYNTFSNKIFLYHDVVLPSMVISPLNPLEDLGDEERNIVENMIASDTESERDVKLRQLTEWLLYGLHTIDD